MKTVDIPYDSESDRVTFSLSDLLGRASLNQNAVWVDLPTEGGIYVVHWISDERPVFVGTAGKAKHAIPIDPQSLLAKWDRINRDKPTDIVYIGKADNLRKRVRALVRFGVGKARNHRGGQSMWQVADIASANILLQKCPKGKEVALENWLLERFYKEHGDWPLANREGPEGQDWWWPGKE